jgi:hypothetical protein
VARLELRRGHLTKDDFSMPTTTLDTSDAVELAELLQFLHDWLAADPARLGESLNGFVGSPGYDLGELPPTSPSSPSCSAPLTAKGCSPRTRMNSERPRAGRGLSQPI